MNVKKDQVQILYLIKIKDTFIHFIVTINLYPNCIKLCSKGFEYLK